MNAEVRSYGKFVGGLTLLVWAIWFGTGWPHHHFWWLWGTLIAIGVWLLLTFATYAQAKLDADIEQSRLKRKLETHERCPTCGGEGWIPR